MRIEGGAQRVAWRGGREVDGECERRGARESGESGVERQMDTMDIDCKDIDCKDIEVSWTART